ncbi:MAG: lactate utilization protein C [Gammaproteobacteria bacterium]|nr:lactate utilization protein C [Gammaproteobacteria bacterium]
MSSAKEQVLARIRAANGGAADPAIARARIEAHARQIEPAFDDDLADRFLAKLEAAAATVARVSAEDRVVTEIEAYLERNGLDQKIVAGDEAVLRQLDWPPGFTVEQRVPRGDDVIGLTSALCGIAETGTLMLTSAAGRPTSLNFLPDYHVVVLRRAQLVARMEDAWDKLRAEPGAMPRTVNFISGPSKTADVEQTVEYGAHGPRCLHVVLIDG